MRVLTAIQRQNTGRLPHADVPLQSTPYQTHLSADWRLLYQPANLDFHAADGLKGFDRLIFRAYFAVAPLLLRARHLSAIPPAMPLG